jgi:hypothetical protein
MFPNLTAGQQARVLEEILNFTSMSARKHVENEAAPLTASNRMA